MTTKLRFFALGVFVCFSVISWVEAERISMVPPVKECRLQSHTCALDAGTVIVIGDKATQVDEYAAQRLQSFISKRFNVTLDIKRESSCQDAKTSILLGTRESCAAVDRLCGEHQIALDENHPGFDGYIIETMVQDGNWTVLIGGSNGRGVTYGMSTFFDLLTQDKDTVVFPGVFIKDWPTLQWRGRTCVRSTDENTYDLYVQSRCNFVDTLYPMVGLGKNGYAIDRQRVLDVLRESHRRGLFVFGIVNCSVKAEVFDEVCDAFRQLLDMGVDGLWLSFDDAGEGVHAEVLVKHVMEIAREHGLSYDKMFITPADGSYQNIETSWNKLLASQDDFDKLKWLFTRPPCDCDLQSARKIGLEATLPGWWHNWPRPAGGLLHQAYSSSSMYDGIPYLEPLPLEIGWHMPTYRELADADKYTDTAVVCFGEDGKEYIMPTFGYWAWDPARHDWNATVNAVYAYVYGPGQVEDVKTFDENFSKLKTMFTRMLPKTQSPELWPPRFIDCQSRPNAIHCICVMEEMLKKLRAKAPSQSLLEAGVLEKYFSAMQNTVLYGRKLASLEYPEYWLPDFDNSMISLVKSDLPAAAKRIEDVKPKVVSQLGQITKELSGMKGIDEYIAYWEQRISCVEYWKDRVGAIERRKVQTAKRRQQMADIWKSEAKINEKDLAEMLAAQDKRPAGKILCEITPTQLLQEGDLSWEGQGWRMGVAKVGEKEAFAIQFDGTCNEKDSATATINIPVPEHKGRLNLAVCVNHLFVDKNVPPVRGGRFSVIKIGKKWSWNQDSANEMRGHEWAVFELIASDDGDVKAGDVKQISLQVYNKKPNTGLTTTTLFGPIFVIEDTK